MTVVGYGIFQTCFSLPLVQQIYLRFHSNKEHNEMVPDKTQSPTSRLDTVYYIFYLPLLALQSYSPSFAMHIEGTIQKFDVCVRIHVLRFCMA